MPVVVNKATEIKALIDSGASSNFMHQETAKKLGLPLQEQKEPQPVKDIQGRPLGWIDKFTRIRIDAGTHREVIDFNIIPLGIHELVLGLPWLQKHDPEIKWRERKIKFNSLQCKRIAFARSLSSQKAKRKRTLENRFSRKKRSTT